MFTLSTIILVLSTIVLSYTLYKIFSTLYAQVLIDAIVYDIQQREEKNNKK